MSEYKKTLTSGYGKKSKLHYAGIESPFIELEK